MLYHKKAKMEKRRTDLLDSKKKSIKGLTQVQCGILKILISLEIVKYMEDASDFSRIIDDDRKFDSAVIAITVIVLNRFVKLLPDLSVEKVQSAKDTVSSHLNRREAWTSFSCFRDYGTGALISPNHQKKVHRLLFLPILMIFQFLDDPSTSYDVDNAILMATVQSLRNSKDGDRKNLQDLLGLLVSSRRVNRKGLTVKEYSASLLNKNHEDPAVHIRKLWKYHRTLQGKKNKRNATYLQRATFVAHISGFEAGNLQNALSDAANDWLVSSRPAVEALNIDMSNLTINVDTAGKSAVVHENSGAAEENTGLAEESTALVDENISATEEHTGVEESTDPAEEITSDFDHKTKCSIKRSNRKITKVQRYIEII